MDNFGAITCIPSQLRGVPHCHELSGIFFTSINICCIPTGVAVLNVFMDKPKWRLLFLEASPYPEEEQDMVEALRVR